MPGEATDEVLEVGTADTDEDFDSGFNTTATPTTTPATAEKFAPIEEEAPQQLTYAQITEDQFKTLMQKADEVDTFKVEAQKRFDTAFGQLGGLKQSLERLQGAPAGQGGPVEITPDDFSELTSEFPELAKLQIAGIQKVLNRMNGAGSSASPQALNEVVQRSVREAVLATQLEGLNDVVDNWEQEVKTPAFSEWFASQDAATKALSASENPRDSAKLLRAFSARTAAAPPSKAIPSTRKLQLEAAAAPRTARGLAPEAQEVDDFEAGFNSSRN